MGDPRAVVNPLARHYTRFRVSERLLLTGHSHQAWPDVAFDGHIEAFEDAALHVDTKWERAFDKAEHVHDGFRALLGEPSAEIALGTNTHELVVRFLSALELGTQSRLITTDGEFHTLRRQMARLRDAGLDVVVVAARPVGTLADRLADALDDSTAAVLVSAVLFEDARIVPHLDRLAIACRERHCELLVDAYHALGVIPFRPEEKGLNSAWIVGGGYKYLQLGEGNCFLRIPAHAYEARPIVTGWFAEFGDLTSAPGDRVEYGRGAAAFGGSTYDPTSHYRAARVFQFFEHQGLTPERLRESYLHQLDVLASGFDALDLPEERVTRDRETPLESLGGFLALRSPRAGELQATLAERGVLTDSRGDFLRFGPAPYLDDSQLARAIGILGDAVRASL
ncbi:MAG: kynureninase [Actinobacteria bacterium]|nr:kynureninase [Actinomycetota bacterium]